MEAVLELDLSGTVNNKFMEIYMKRNSFLISLNIFILFCFVFSSCELSDSAGYGDGPTVQGNITITGLDAYNGNYLTLYGNMKYGSTYSVFISYTILIGTTKLTKKKQYVNVVEIREDSLYGAQIANGSFKIPYYTMDSSGNVNTIKTDPPYSFSTVRLYITTEKSMKFKPCLSTENVIATAMMPADWQESRDFTINKSQLTEWFNF